MQNPITVLAGSIANMSIIAESRVVRACSISESCNRSAVNAAKRRPWPSGLEKFCLIAIVGRSMHGYHTAGY